MLTNIRQTISSCILLSTILLLTIVGSISGLAQEAPEEDTNVTIALKSARVSDALKTLFEFRPDETYVLRAKDVGQYPLSISLDDVSFDVALRNILQAANLTYKKKANVYTITKKPVEKPASQPVQLPVKKPILTARIPIMNLEAGTIAAALGGYTLKLSSNPYDNSRASNTNNGNSRKKGKGKNRGSVGNQNQVKGQRR
ncbi:MAG: STN domain-containing protein [Armatimonadota bacterium]